MGCGGALSPRKSPTLTLLRVFSGYEEMRSFVLVLMSACASAYILPSGIGSKMQRVERQQLTMGLFDGLKSAFENDDTLGDRPNAGLSKEATKRTVTWVGPKGEKKTATAIPGQKLRDIARSCRIPIKYDCNEGTCKTCEAMVGNSRAKIWCARVTVAAILPHIAQPACGLIASLRCVHSVTKMPNKDVTIKYNIR